LGALTSQPSKIQEVVREKLLKTSKKEPEKDKDQEKEQPKSSQKPKEEIILDSDEELEATKLKLQRLQRSKLEQVEFEEVYLYVVHRNFNLENVIQFLQKKLAKQKKASISTPLQSPISTPLQSPISTPLQSPMSTQLQHRSAATPLQSRPGATPPNLRTANQSQIPPIVEDGTSKISRLNAVYSNFESSPSSEDEEEDELFDDNICN